jgi:predicted nucleic acid-binding protein
MLVWWSTELECVSAVARRERAGARERARVGDAIARIDDLKTAWEEIAPHAGVRRTARRLLRLHPLGAVDALQLAAAIVGSDGDPSTLEFVCLDRQLSAAAAREGFPILPA